MQPMHRVRTDSEHLEVELNNEGFPLTAVDWPEGSLADFPAALCGKEWQGDLPAKSKSPIILHPGDVRSLSQYRRQDT